MNDFPLKHGTRAGDPGTLNAGTSIAFFRQELKESGQKYFHMLDHGLDTSFDVINNEALFDSSDLKTDKPTLIFFWRTTHTEDNTEGQHMFSGVYFPQKKTLEVIEPSGPSLNNFRLIVTSKTLTPHERAFPSFGYSYKVDFQRPYKGACGADRMCALYSMVLGASRVFFRPQEWRDFIDSFAAIGLEKRSFYLRKYLETITYGKHDLMALSRALYETVRSEPRVQSYRHYKPQIKHLPYETVTYRPGRVERSSSRRVQWSPLKWPRVDDPSN